MNLPSSEKSASALLPSLIQIDAERMRRNLPAFCRSAWHILEPSTELVWSWHLDAIAEHLTAVTKGQLRNLIINIGPGHMKSLMVCVFWPCWEWTFKPDRRWLFASYAGSLSVRDSLKCRRLIESDWYQSHFGGGFKLNSDEFYGMDGDGNWVPTRQEATFELVGDQNAKLKFENTKTGYRIATSVGGTATGERANRIVADDPHNVKERESDAKREGVLDWWDQVFSNRLCDYRTDARVVIHQRVHEKDLTGHLLKRGGYEHLCLPTEYDPSRRCVTSIGWQDPRTKEGELLFPQRFGAAEVAEAKVTLGPTGYAGQHQQLPNVAGGGRFKSKWFRYYMVEGEFYRLTRGSETWAVKIDDCDRYAVMDPAGTDPDQNEKACYTVIQVWDLSPSGDMILVDQYREQVETPDASEAAVRIAQQNDCILHIEKDGLGLGVVQTIRRRGIPVKAIKAKGSKEARSEVAEIFMAAGYVHFPANAPWRFDLETECLRFPNTEFKDQVDTLSHAAKVAMMLRGAPKDARDDAYTERKEQEQQAAEELKSHPGASLPPDAVTVSADGEDPEAEAWLRGE